VNLTPGKRPDVAGTRPEADRRRSQLKLVLLLAAVQGARGNQAGAEAAYQEAIQLDPGHAEASIALADFYVAGGKLD
jgi:cytochrome c-type biogenesis protein CcmH/NrfG